MSTCPFAVVSVIVPVPVPLAIEAPTLALLRLTLKVSLPSVIASKLTVTVTGLLVSPGAKVSVVVETAL
jgi:hypothetical protein